MLYIGSKKDALAMRAREAGKHNEIAAKLQGKCEDVHALRLEAVAVIEEINEFLASIADTPPDISVFVPQTEGLDSVIDYEAALVEQLNEAVIARIVTAKCGSVAAGLLTLSWIVTKEAKKKLKGAPLSWLSGAMIGLAAAVPAVVLNVSNKGVTLKATDESNKIRGDGDKLEELLESVTDLNNSTASALESLKAQLWDIKPLEEQSYLSMSEEEQELLSALADSAASMAEELKKRVEGN
ncbi:MAG: hypothetical protein LBT59_21795 [Clostridiales bacterium]|nr:hypothetical protein [Clostridiales bacterium]